MIRKVIERTFDEDTRYVEMFGLSTGDVKPTEGLITGSRFTEVDTGDVYLYDEIGDGTAGAWHKVAAGWTAPADADG